MTGVQTCALPIYLNGVRYSKTVNGVTTTYYYDGDKLIGEDRSNGIKLRYFYDEQGVFGFKHIKNGLEQDFRYVRNILGDVEYLLDSQGKVVAEYYYDIWGNSMLVRDFTGYGEINPFRYRGYYYDTESRLYYLITRYYDPRLGVFLTRDSTEYLEPEEVGGVDLYAYCYNNPIMYIDPTGHFAITTSFIIGLLVTIGCCAAVGAVAGGVSAAVNNENIWNGIWKGTLVGLMVGGSIALTAFGLSAPLAGTILGSAMVGAGIGSGFAMLTNLSLQLQNRGFGSLDMKSLATSWGVGMSVGALAGTTAHVAKGIGFSFGEMLGLELSGKTFLGMQISKVVSSSILYEGIGLLGGSAGGFLGGVLINYIAKDTGLQNHSVPLLFGTFLKLLFGIN